MEYKIYQIKDTLNCPYAYYDHDENTFNFEDYKEVYSGKVIAPSVVNDLEDVLEELFDTFNIRRPGDYEGRNLSISDIIELNGKYFYCMGTGWKELSFKAVVR